MRKPSVKKLENDPGMVYVNEVIAYYRSSLMASMTMHETQLEEAREKYMKLIQLKESRNFYPDANSTMRVTYGTVQ